MNVRNELDILNRGKISFIQVKLKTAKSKIADEAHGCAGFLR